ncbi:hypothetical protein GGI04_002795 [Coemansia thaxteri]|uniref:Arrestin C-terminal-like domain-containing protein n=1 Tax=Coemansia thaxteri TaxID=2663907 RepID=A0A9W8EKB3_9FUNG|nr:hypothetical protein GGI04_002795 [Coemansia thaxteri]KAJ2004905.1 hypothetical protein H4R26_002248 [Coemansia thaxteri]KAJ2471004.1 hypothetical protein GGI02_002553 [Coemansia sp. RSA 2322]
MTKGNRLEFELDQPDILLRGMVDDAPGTVFSGRLVVSLSESIRVKGLKMVLEGHELLEWEYQSDGAMSTFHRETAPLTHRWNFFTTADGKKVETWEAGRHAFPFSIVFPGNLPETLTLPYANVAYQLKATLHRIGIMPNISAKRDIAVKRDLSADGGFGTGAINVESRWREKLEFRISGDADTFVPGDRMRAKFTFQPLVKHMRLDKIGVVLKEYVRCHTPTGGAEKVVSRIAGAAEVVPNKCESGNFLEESAIFDSLRRHNLPVTLRDQAASTLVGFPDRDVPCYSAEPTSVLQSPSLSRSSTLSPPCMDSGDANPSLLPGVELTHAVEELIQLTIPRETRRMQYEHISSYVEVTHKLKFSIRFTDPSHNPHTLWISVPVSIVPIINDCTHNPTGELPTYANAALDERVAVASIDPNPPTYDAVITESLSRATSRSPETLPMGITATMDSSCSTADMPAIDILPPTAAESELASETDSLASDDYHEHSSTVTGGELLDVGCPGSVDIAYRRVSLTHLTVDSGRPLVHPAAVHSFFRHRQVVFPASAEATPSHTPYHLSPAASLGSSPVLKSSDEVMQSLANLRMSPGRSIV